jgi:hypothetical protein
MELVTKPDFAEARERWEAFWHHDIIRRPIVCITAPRQKRVAADHPHYFSIDTSDTDTAAFARRAKAIAESIFWGGEAIPIPSLREASLGPDQYAAYLGGRLESSPDSPGTTWAVPVVASWKDTLPVRLSSDCRAWRTMLQMVETYARIGEGSFLVAVPDLHSNMDALSALRGPERLMLDLCDAPEMIDRAMEDVRATYQPIYEAIFEAGRMRERGTIGWLPHYSAGRFATVQSDVICMLSPEHFHRWVLPALEEETTFLDHSIMHYDGPRALIHLDDVLAIETLDGIQWVPGDGAPPMVEWLDLLRRIQAAGKSIWLSATMDEIRDVYCRELRPELTVYSTSASSEREACEFLACLERHT